MEVAFERGAGVSSHPSGWLGTLTGLEWGVLGSTAQIIVELKRETCWVQATVSGARDSDSDNLGVV